MTNRSFVFDHLTIFVNVQELMLVEDVRQLHLTSAMALDGLGTINLAALANHYAMGRQPWKAAKLFYLYHDGLKAALAPLEPQRDLMQRALGCLARCESTLEVQKLEMKVSQAMIATYPSTEIMDECSSRFYELYQGPAGEDVTAVDLAFVLTMTNISFAISLDYSNLEVENAVRNSAGALPKHPGYR